MLKILRGPCGAGKSREVYKSVVNDLRDGKKVCLIVPEQMALYSERTISELSGDVSELELEVLSFRRLADRVFREYGGLSYDAADKAGKALIMWRVLFDLSPYLEQFSLKDGDVSVVDLVIETIDSFRQYSITPAMLDKAAEKVRESDKILYAKLRELSLIYSGYTGYTKYEFDDVADELTKLAEVLKTNAFFDGYSVYFDGFDGFVPQQYAVIREIMRQSELVSVSLSCVAEDKTGLFDTTQKTLVMLKKLAGDLDIKAEETVFEEQIEIRSDDVRFLSSNFWKHVSSPASTDRDIKDVRMIECSNEFEECEFVSNDILRRVREENCRFRDFTVIARDAGQYEGLIDSYFSNAGIPFFMSKREDVTTKPVFKMILSALAIKKNNWDYPDVISYVKSGLSSLTHEECDLIENYAVVWNIRGKGWTGEHEWNMNPDGLFSKITDAGRNKIDRLNAIRKKIVDPLFKFFDSFEKGTVREMTMALFDFLTENGVREKIAEKASYYGGRNENELRNETLLLWDTLVSGLDKAVRFCGDMTVGYDDYNSMLKLLLSKTDFGSIPASVDEVLIGSASSLRSGRNRHVYLIGVNEGVFPKAVAENKVFSDRELNDLLSFDLYINPDTAERSSDELFYFYKCISSASDTLTLSYPVSGLTGESKKRSFAAERVNSVFGGRILKEYSSFSPESRVQSRTAALKLYSLEKGTPFGDAIYDVLSEDGKFKNAIEAFSTPLDASGDRIEIKTAQKLYKDKIKASQSRIERFVKCRFAYHANYILGLNAGKKAEFRANDKGTFVHFLLEKFLYRVTSGGKEKIGKVSREEIEKITDELTDEYVCKLDEVSSFGTEKLKRLLRRLRKLIILLLNNIVAEFGQSLFTPAYFELVISDSDKGRVRPYEIELENGRKISVNGVVDRVDTMKDGEKLYFRVVDYKTNKEDFNMKNVEKGLDMQMFLYMLALWKGKDGFLAKDNCINDPDKNVIPAGVLYFPAKLPNLGKNGAKLWISEEEASNAAERTLKRRGVVLDDPAIIRAMESEVESKYIPVKYNLSGDYNTSSTSVMTLEQFGELAEKIDGVLIKLAGEMLNGMANANPINGSVCGFCDFKPCCRATNAVEDDEGDGEGETDDE